MKRVLHFLFLAALIGLLLQQAARADQQPEQIQIGENPFENSGFEAGNLDPWINCGGVKLVDAQAAGTTSLMVHSGRYAVRLGQPIDDSCGNGALGPAQVLAEDVTIPSDADDVTLSFWYSALGDWAAGEIVLEWSDAPTSYLGHIVSITSFQTDEVMAGWHLFRQNLRPADVAKVRGQTLYLTIYVRFQGQPDWNWNIYLDDLKVTAAREQTVGAPLPADLAADGTRPLVVTGPGVTNDHFGLYRIDTDGSGRIRLADLDTRPSFPTWSPDGKQIVYQTEWLEPEANNDPKKFPALIGRAWLLNADGSNRRPIFRTLGREGTKDDPPGCIRTNTCNDTGLDALDGLLDNLHWSPDSAHLAATICVRSRWYNSDKPTSDATCQLSLHQLQAGNEVPVVGTTKWITDAQGASWSAAGKILFIAGPSLTTRPKGVWELDTTLQPAQATQLFTWLTASGDGIDLRPNPDSDPTWSPDNRHFVTYRKAQSVHYAPIDDAVGGLRVNYHIFLHDRQNPAVGRQLLLVDQGELAGRPTWSPDGRYLLYTLFNDQQTNADIWWLQVETGATGRLTQDGLSLNADWRPTNTRPAPAPTGDHQIYLPSVQNGGGSSAPTATPQPGVTAVAFPTLTPTTAVTPLPTPSNVTPAPPRGISGRVFYQGAGVAGINVQIESCIPSGTCQMVQRTQTDATGNYAFPTAPSAGSFGYQVTYRNGSEGNNPDDPRFLLVWQSARILDYLYGRRIPDINFEIGDVTLTAPADNATVALPVTFTWNSRGIAGEKYQWVTNADLFDTCDQITPDTNTSFVLESLSCDSFIHTETPYTWQVNVIQEGDHGGNGISHLRTVSFGAQD